MDDPPLTVLDRQPMALTDQRGGRLFAWLPPGTATDRAHVLPGPVYAALCRSCGLEGRPPWVAFDLKLRAVEEGCVPGTTRSARLPAGVAGRCYAIPVRPGVARTTAAPDDTRDEHRGRLARGTGAPSA